jgi:hypothetical protein
MANDLSAESWAPPLIAVTAVSFARSLDAGPFTGTTVIATKSLPGSITGVAQVQVVPGGGPVLFNGASLGGVGVRERVILIWVR